MDRITGRAFATRSEVLAPRALAATSQPLATQVALELLRRGGSAVDAAIGANAMLGLVEPTGCGLGGDLFAIVHDPGEAELVGLNASGRSPAALTLAELRTLGLDYLPPRGPLTLSVPGCVDGWSELSRRYGRLELSEVLAPAIDYAREGAPISEVIAFTWEAEARALHDSPGFSATFLVGGRAPRKGERLRNRALADSLERISAEERDWFYRGEAAERISAFVRENGGWLSGEDFAEHRSEWVQPISTGYRGVEVHELPPNGQGLAALQILNLLEAESFAPADFGSARHLHAFLEAKKLAFEDRARLYADPDFYETPVEVLASKAYAAERWRHFDPHRAGASYPVANPALDAGDTVYLCTADERGQMVSLIQSNYHGFGSGLVPPGLGFGLQNRGQLFDLTPGRPNSYAPRKRPFHTIIPAFLTREGEPWAAFGVMGGDAQPQAHAQVVMNLVDFGMSWQEAGDAPRVLHTGSSDPQGRRMTDGGRVFLESGFSWETIRALMGLGHRIGWNVGEYGGYQAVAREGGVWRGASESRKDGQAAGY